jgi:hypothetical protein
MILLRRLFPKLFSYEDSESFVNRCRRRRAVLIWQCLESYAPSHGRLRILDVGGGLGFWRAIGLPDPHRYHVTLLNLDRPLLNDHVQGFSFVEGDACRLPYERGDFDVVMSNSVIEHVGWRDDRVCMAAEISRVSDCYIVQTPSFWFPIEPHVLLPCFQFLPATVAGVLVRLFRISGIPRGDGSFAACIEGVRKNCMLTRSQFRSCFPDATIYSERLLGLTKSYIAIHGFQGIDSEVLK